MTASARTRPLLVAALFGILVSAPSSAASRTSTASSSDGLSKTDTMRRAAAELEAGNLRAAEALLQGAADRFDSVDALLELARIQALDPQRGDVLDTLRRALGMAPNSEQILSAFARTSLARRQPVPAIRSLEALVRMHPTVADYPYLLGVAQLQIGENQSAVEALQIAQRLDVERPQTYVALGMAHNQQKEFEIAREMLGRALTLAPGSVEAFAALAETSEGLGAYEEAERYALRVLSEIERHAGAHLVIGKIRMNEKRYEEAQSALERSIAADPTSSKAHYQLHLAHARLGNTERAQHHLDRYRETLREAEEYLVELRTRAGLGVSGMKR